GAPQGNNKIYTYDVVFIPGEARIKSISKTSIPYKITKEISKRSLISRLQVVNSRTASTSKPRGSVLDASASSYLPRSITKLVR
ncbi:MAG: hypothetical protein SOZ09_10850, partial [Eubacteriales bacterium]|nr:hypothetical protein [Eubacteriales bacterium]